MLHVFLFFNLVDDMCLRWGPSCVKICVSMICVSVCAGMAFRTSPKVVGSETTGNVLVCFDVNGFGETITAPHIRRPPINQDVFLKILRAVNMARHGTPDVGNMPPGEIFCVLDGGRVNNAMFAKVFGVGPGMKKQKVVRGETRTICRSTLVTLNEPSVKGRKARLAKGAAHDLHQNATPSEIHSLCLGMYS